MRQAWFISLLVSAVAGVQAGCADAKESEGRVDAAPDVVTPDAMMSNRKAGPGEACEQTSDCQSLPLHCVDGVCCKTRCDGVCEQCDLSGTGDCQATPANSDPDNECGELDCSGYFSGWTGNSCFSKANISAIAATCDGARACETADALCSRPGGDPGPAAITCVSGCQTAREDDTCTGTTIGVCEGPGDPQEPNNSCAEVATLPVLDGLARIPPNDQDPLLVGQITPAGDTDVLEIVVRETNLPCGTCAGGANGNFLIQIFPSVPAGAGNVTFCNGRTCGAENNCQVVNAGTGGFIQVPLTGMCTGQTEHRVFLRVSRADGGSACGQYQYGYEFVHFCP